LFVLLAAGLILAHFSLLRLPYFWDEAGYYVPAARDLLSGSLIPYSTPSNAHPPLVLAWLAVAWKIFGQAPIVTRCAMLLLAGFSLLGFFRLAKAVSNTTVAAASTFLTAVYPVFFAQSSLAQIDLPAAGLTFWALEAHFRRRSTSACIWFSLAALAKETAILVPLALLLWEWLRPSALRAFDSHDRYRSEGASAPEESRVRSSSGVKSISFKLLFPILPLALWYAYHYWRTGFVFGNPEFFRYNVQGTLHPLRIVLALLLRIWQMTGYLGLYVLTIACFLAMRFSPGPLAHKPPALDPSKEGTPPGERPRIRGQVQLAFLAIATVYLLAMSVIGGAVLARYMLPIVPLWILICVSTVWRRMRPWTPVFGVVAAAVIASIFLNPPYGFSPEDNLAYRDYIRLHQHAEAFLQARFPKGRVLTAWPASDELTRPYLGYVSEPMQVVKIKDFTAEQLLSAAEAPLEFDVALVFSTKYQPPNSYFDRWRLWRQWKSRYFGYHVDLSPEAAASVLGGNLVYVERRRGQWAGVIHINRVKEAVLITSPTAGSRKPVR
jgi:Dolichyl-phosphate-mannose-protein mannosyltransferase